MNPYVMLGSGIGTSEATSLSARLAAWHDAMVAHEAHIAFHRRLWEASENILLIRLWSVTEAHITILLARDQQTREDPRRAHDVHERIVAALIDGDLDEIHAALVAHTIDSAEELVEMLEVQGAGPGA